MEKRRVASKIDFDLEEMPNLTFYNNDNPPQPLPPEPHTEKERERIFEKKITMSVYRVLTKSDPVCEIEYVMGNQVYCFRVHCQTGQYLGSCI
jgi:hypothetical protein